jgi:hypothetical protein
MKSRNYWSELNWILSLSRARTSIMGLAPTLAYKSGIKKKNSDTLCMLHITACPQSPLQTVRAFHLCPGCYGTSSRECMPKLHGIRGDNGMPAYRRHGALHSCCTLSKCQLWGPYCTCFRPYKSWALNPLKSSG